MPAVELLVADCGMTARDLGLRMTDYLIRSCAPEVGIDKFVANGLCED